MIGSSACAAITHFATVTHCCITVTWFLMALFCTSSRGTTGGGGRVGDLCSQNTDCRSGMYCSMGQCTCLSNYVPIGAFCWPKVNPGDSGCVGDQQCEAVWPGAHCTRAGLCECPEHRVPARTRDGTVCVTNGVPPACPLPEPDNPEVPSPATLLANPSTHPLAPDSYMPVLCTSSSTETADSNGGDGSSWCVYPDGERDLYIADLYNCVPHPQIRPEYFPEYAPTVDGICCHSRAFVCVQPMVQGDAPSVPRWWYNSVTGTCTQFLWDPAQSENVSPNNFRTAEHCESYCRDTCRRGPVEFARAPHARIPDELAVSNCARAHAGGCAPENTCMQIGSLQQCCPTIAHLCSPAGGRALPPFAGASASDTRDAFDPGVQIAGAVLNNRFYYDAEQGRCTNFLYEGGLGNYNNFGTKQDCDNFCSKLVCELGAPLRVAEGQWQRCESGEECPSTHTCNAAHKVCCPTAQTICTQPKLVGDCTGSVGRYWYNAATRQCELFDYTGCQGNDNNFAHLMECQLKCRNIGMEPRCPQGRAHRDAAGHFTRCTPGAEGGAGCPPNYACHPDGHGCCPTRAWTCTLGADRGVQCGAGRSMRFYFDAAKQSCESFQYEGCDGNANNFQSADACQEYCGAGGCPNGGQPLRDAATHHFLDCSDAHACPDAHECVSVNAYGTVAHRCCPTKAHICSQPPQVGNACRKGQLTRWYFNIVTRECGKFAYGGCNGNLNNFENQEQCNVFCSSAACAPGELAFRKEPDDGSLRSATRIVQQCDLHDAHKTCPRNFRCVHDALGHRHVCCGAPASNVCVEGEKAYWNALDETVRECQANVAGSCPADYVCRYSTAYNKYFCCAPRDGNICPEGRVLYRTPRSLQPVRCLVGDAPAGTQQCPDEFSCQSRVTQDLQGHCCSIKEVCRGGAAFLLDERTQMPRVCTPQADPQFAACPRGYHCSSGRGESVCCKGEEPSAEDNALRNAPDGCPPGQSALVRDASTSSSATTVQCDPFNPRDKGCPSGFTCQFARIHQRYQCCAFPKTQMRNSNASATSKERVIDQGCPGGQVSALDPLTLASRVCTVHAPGACPRGYSCQFSERNAQFQCCAHKAGCPGNSVAFVDSTAAPQRCVIEARVRQCPTGYACVRAQDGARDKADGICCTLEEGEPVPEPPTVTAPTIEPRIDAEHISTTIHPEASKKGVRKKCKPNEVRVDGECRRRKLGEACIVAEHCAESADCIDYACECAPGTRPRNAWECELAPPKPRKKDRNRKTQNNNDNNKIGARCKRDAQCEWNGARCIAGRCRCTRGTAAFRNQCKRHVCGGDHFRLPQLGALGDAIQCVGGDAHQCAWPNRCTFSRSLHAYICCRSASTRYGGGMLAIAMVRAARRRKQPPDARVNRDRRCADGSRPLLYPGSTSPVQCLPHARRCPANFQCWQQLCCRDAAHRGNGRRRILRVHARSLPALSAWHVVAHAQPATEQHSVAALLAGDNGENDH